MYHHPLTQSVALFHCTRASDVLGGRQHGSGVVGYRPGSCSTVPSAIRGGGAQLRAGESPEHFGQCVLHVGVGASGKSARATSTLADARTLPVHAVHLDGLKEYHQGLLHTLRVVPLCVCV